MTNRVSATLVLMLTCYLAEVSFGLPAEVQGTSQVRTPIQSPAEKDILQLAGEEVPPGVVSVEGRTILTVYEPIGTLNPQQRAGAIAERIVSFAASGGSPGAVRLKSREAWTEIFVDNVLMMAVTDADARIAGKEREQLAAEYAEKIRIAIHNYRHDHSWKFVVSGILKTGLTTLILVILLWLIRQLRTFARARLQSYIVASRRPEPKTARHVAVVYLGPTALALGGITRWVVILVLLQAYLAVT